MAVYPRWSSGQLGSTNFVAPVAGVYVFFANVRFDATASSNYYRLMIVKNADNDYANGAMHINGAPPSNCTFCSP